MSMTTQEELQKRYDHLLERVRRMRGIQVQYERYRTDNDRKTKKELERQVDNILRDEVKKIVSKQPELR